MFFFEGLVRPITRSRHFIIEKKEAFGIAFL